MSDYRVHAIDPARISTMRDVGRDEHGNPFTPFAAAGWEPLRCCLRIAEKDEQIALISYAPFEHRSPWTEVGPVYLHADPCDGYADDGLPAQLRTGPRILRTYRGDGTLDYAHVTLVPEGEDLEPALRKVLAEPEVETVHVRAMLTQCFTYAVESVRPTP